MAVALAGTPTTYDNASTTSFPLAVPTGAVVGEILVAFVMTAAGGLPITGPSGFTALQVGHDNGPGAALDSGLWLGYRVVTGTEAGSYTWTSASSARGMATMFRVSGADAAGTPIRTSAGKFTNTTRSQTDTAPALSGVQATDGEFFFWACGDDTFATLGGFVNLGSPWTTVTARTIGAKGTYIAYATGNNTTPRATSSTANTIWTSAGIAFQAATGGDVTAPTVPSSVTATAVSATQVTVAWTASTDAVGVASYRVIRGGAIIAAAVSGTSYVDTTVLPSTAYSYTVSAVDAAGNRSAESTAAAVTTPAGVVPTVTITPTALPNNVPPAIRLDLTDTRTPPAHLLTVVRNNPDGTTSTVRTSDGTPLVMNTSGATTVGLIFDYEAYPYGGTFTYSTVEFPSAVSPSVTLNVSRPWLVHPGIPSLSVPINFRPGSFQSMTYAAKQGVFYPLGRKNPVVVTDGARKGGSGSMVLQTDTLDDLSALLDLLSDAGTLLLNVPDSLGAGPVSQYVAVGDVTVTRLTDNVIDGYRDITMPFTVVDAPIGGNQAERTFADLMAYPTLDAIKAAYPTLIAVLAGP